MFEIVEVEDTVCSLSCLNDILLQRIKIIAHMLFLSHSKILAHALFLSWEVWVNLALPMTYLRVWCLFYFLHISSQSLLDPFSWCAWENNVSIQSEWSYSNHKLNGALCGICSGHVLELLSNNCALTHWLLSFNNLISWAVALSIWCLMNHRGRCDVSMALLGW